MVEFFTEFWQFLRERKKWWLLPIILVAILLGFLLLFAPVGVTPFVYTVF
ncbi:MAG: DUF5989 family protein [Chitinophagales bacterium]|nr:DUF5989 family protein [Chitinophagales bacterium]